MRWLGCIYSLQPLPSRWLFLLAMGTPDSPVVHPTVTVHCPVCATSAHPLGFGADDRWNPLSCSCTRQSGATPDISGVLWLLRSDFCCALFTTVPFCSRPLAHRTVRWIIAECAQKKPESELFEWNSAWRTGDCPMRHLSAHSQVLLQILLSPQLNFFLGLCWTLCAWDKWHLDKLISPRGLWWTSTTKIDYRKWLSPFPFKSLPFWWLMPTQTKANIRYRNVTSLQLRLMCIG
jgi:hypothetical protein